LTQEARGAARKLRVEVGEMRSTGTEPDEDRASSLPGELTLDQLDNAIDVLSQLEAEPRSRRKGLLDLAAILYELAPDWQVMLEPGAGTQVSGDEEEYRRMLQVLLTQSGIGRFAENTPAVEIRRDGEWVRVTTGLGPDVASSGELERRWLSRMAVRLGGRYELLGKSHSLVLPADNDDRVELKALRDELLQAQQLGQSYALELAQAMSTADRGLATEERTAHEAVRWALRAAALSGAGASETLACIARVDPSEASNEVRVAGVVERALERVATLARSRGVLLEAAAIEGSCEASPALFEAQLELLLRHALQATPSGDSVGVRAVERDGAVRIEVEHGVELDQGGLQVRVAPPSTSESRPPSFALLASATLCPAESPGAVVVSKARGARWVSSLVCSTARGSGS
jgi:hypothetical protein